MCVRPCESRPSGVSSSLSESEGVCVAFVVVSSHIHVSLPLWPLATFCISLWLLRLHPSPVNFLVTSSAHVNEHMSIRIVCLCVYVQQSECIPSYAHKGHLNVPAILPRGNPICRLAPVWIMQAGWAVAKLCLRGEATQRQNTHTSSSSMDHSWEWCMLKCPHKHSTAYAHTNSIYVHVWCIEDTP